MLEERAIEEAEVYQPPVLVEVGGYAEVTEGFTGETWDNFGGFFGLG
ncbi:lasso RiPP family leader peptide-containing protein [Streptomyces longisporoflavus]|uniref:Lasso RiPP family leader peptide-containing protein n=1 Tax=Streptomyces longisporoflavus TaxID=28044 RepID=A0ABW7R342_9ACTN